jgi:hypothetical protein
VSARRNVFLKTWWSPYLGEWRPFHDNYIYSYNEECVFSGDATFQMVNLVFGFEASPIRNTLGYSFEGVDISGSSPNANSFLTFQNPGGVSAIASNGSTFVALGSNGKVTPNPISLGLYSSDGITWSLSNLTSVRTNANAAMEDVIWDGNRFLAVAGGDPNLVTSPDGITWSAVTNATSGLAISTSLPVLKEAFIYYDNTSYWVGSTAFYKSNNGINYTAQTLTGYTRLYSMLKTSNEWLLGATSASGGKIFRSTDSINWSAVTIPSNSAVFTLATNGSVILAGTQGSSTTRMISSTDGINWSSVTSANSFISSDCYEIIYDGSKFIATGNNAIISSTDGITWSALNQSATANQRALAVSKR